MSKYQNHPALALLQRYPKPTPKNLSYGTAGFRFEIDSSGLSECIFLRTGMLACARSAFLGKVVGLCVTASHNPVKDNGIKIVDPDGGMLAHSWEHVAFRVANAASAEECLDILLETCGDKHLFSNRSKVLLARDTRPTSEHLEKIAAEGIEILGGEAISIGIATTPQLHFCVMRKNGFGYLDYEANLSGYQGAMVQSYQDLVEGTKPLPEIFVDCANGVGASMFPIINEELKSFGFSCSLFNTHTSDGRLLNEGCGAEYVQKSRLPPNELPQGKLRYASFDGDADRIVFYSFDSHGNFRLFDGDKIASLIALFVQAQLKELFSDDSNSIGTVQTAYANGASTKYLKNELNVDVPWTKTGVKYLHHKALEYDIGIYFEANGHGTTLFRPSFIQKLRDVEVSSKVVHFAKKRLCALSELLNQATGDAISDLLAVDAMLRVLNLDDESWSKLYVDLPSKQLKVKVVDRSVIETTEDESRCTKPAALQEYLDNAVKKVASGRVFVRPSGTEDVARVYAEAATQSEADMLADEAVKAILQFAGGVSDNKRTRTE